MEQNILSAGNIHQFRHFYDIAALPHVFNKGKTQHANTPAYYIYTDGERVRD